MPQNFSNESGKAPDCAPALAAQLRISEYSYNLPEEKIAFYPLERREQSKLLVWENQQIKNSAFTALPQWLNKDDLLVFNRSRVIRARLYFFTNSGAQIEVFCLYPESPEKPEKSVMTWHCMVGRASKWKDEEILCLKNEAGLELSAQKRGRNNELFNIEFSWNRSEFSFYQVLEACGNLPLPPYLNRKPESDDALRYQTVYADEAGSVAAPTAGLHFTPEMLAQLEQKGVELAYLTLHVGAGTFKPVKSENLAGHTMHQEDYLIPLETIEKLATCKGKIVAVGTTTLRSLESALLTFHQTGDLKNTLTGQWAAMNSLNKSEIITGVSYRGMLEKMQSEGLAFIEGSTSLLIAPPYKIKAVQALMTNFHQPESTLLLLVAAAIGENWKEVYQYALEENYRFLSYGDTSLLFL